MSEEEYEKIHEERAHVSKWKSVSSPTDPADEAPQSSSRTDFDMDIEVVEEIQRRQFEIFASPEVQQKLNELRRDADFQEVRFLHKLKSCKVSFQEALLDDFGFSRDEVGMKELESGIAQHMAASKEVATRMKKLAQLVMGDIWDDYDFEELHMG